MRYFSSAEQRWFRNCIGHIREARDASREYLGHGQVSKRVAFDEKAWMHAGEDQLWR